MQMIRLFGVLGILALFNSAFVFSAAQLQIPEVEISTVDGKIMKGVFEPSQYLSHQGSFRGIIIDAQGKMEQGSLDVSYNLEKDTTTAFIFMTEYYDFTGDPFNLKNYIPTLPGDCKELTTTEGRRVRGHVICNNETHKPEAFIEVRDSNGKEVRTWYSLAYRQTSDRTELFAGPRAAPCYFQGNPFELNDYNPSLAAPQSAAPIIDPSDLQEETTPFISIPSTPPTPPQKKLKKSPFPVLFSKNPTVIGFGGGVAFIYAAFAKIKYDYSKKAPVDENGKVMSFLEYQQKQLLSMDFTKLDVWLRLIGQGLFAAFAIEKSIAFMNYIDSSL